MSVREYVGARYVPLFADPLDWDSTKTYEPLTVVYHQGNSYTSRQYVPAGVDISNTNMWALTGNYNAQIDAYRAEVQTFDGRITQNTNDIDSLENRFPIPSADIADGAITLAKLNNDTLKPHLVVIGDSWSVSGTGMIGHLAGILGIKSANIHNYAQSNTGFLKEFGISFSQQLANAIADTDVPKNAPTYILIVGGTNDYNSGFTNASEYITAINSMLSSIRGTWHNPKVLVGFMQDYYGRVYPKALITAVRQGIDSASINMACPFPYSMHYDAAHLDSNGYKYAAKYIATGFGFGEMSVFSLDTALDFATEFNAQFGNYFKHVYVRPTWNEFNASIQIFIYTNATVIPANTLNGFVNNLNIQCPILPSSYNMETRALTLAKADGINVRVTKTSGNNSIVNIGLRNFADLAANATYSTSINYGW